MKKYFYISILLGAFALSGCIDDKNENQEVAEEAAPIPLNLAQEQKEQYYNQYLKIVEDLSVEYPSVIMELVPLDEFLDDDWVEPKEFEEQIVDFIKNNFFFDEQEIRFLFNSFLLDYSSKYSIQQSDQQLLDSFNP